MIDVRLIAISRPNSCASSKHLQTRRFLDTLQAYFYEIQRILIHCWKEANQNKDSTYTDHTGTLRSAKTNKAIENEIKEEEDLDEIEDKMSKS